MKTVSKSHRRPRVFAWALILSCITFAALWLAFALYETSFYRRALPTSLQTIGLARTGSDYSLWEALLPIRHEACGGAVHRLTPATVEKIREQGLAFFETARQGRGLNRGQKPGYYSYAPWQETPMPRNYTRNGIWLGLNCMPWAWSDEGRSAFEAARTTGSYFTTKHEGVLLVVPELGLVVFTYYG